MHLISGRFDDSIGMMLAGYFVRNTGYPITGPFLALGWIKDDKIVAQAIFNDYTGSNIEMHLYAPKCLSRKTVKEVFEYVFKQLGCERLTAKPYCTNEKLLRLLPRLGFEYECTQEKYYKDGGRVIDAVVFKLTKNNIPHWVNINA